MQVRGGTRPANGCGCFTVRLAVAPILRLFLMFNITVHYCPIVLSEHR